MVEEKNRLEMQRLHTSKLMEFSQTFLQISIDHEDSIDFTELKSQFRDCINSVREYDRVKNIQGLVKILEKRGVLGYYNIDPIKVIATFLKDPCLMKQLNGSDEFCTFVSTKHSTSLKETNSQDFQNLVLTKVGENLGAQWRDVARFLDLTEPEMYSLENICYSEFKQQGLKVLEIFASRCKPGDFYTKLTSALAKARRKDLVELLEELYLNK